MVVYLKNMVYDFGRFATKSGQKALIETEIGIFGNGNCGSFFDFKSLVTRQGRTKVFIFASLTQKNWLRNILFPFCKFACFCY